MSEYKMLFWWFHLLRGKGCTFNTCICLLLILAIGSTCVQWIRGGSDKYHCIILTKKKSRFIPRQLLWLWGITLFYLYFQTCNIHSSLGQHKKQPYKPTIVNWNKTIYVYCHHLLLTMHLILHIFLWRKTCVELIGHICQSLNPSAQILNVTQLQVCFRWEPNRRWPIQRARSLWP